VTHRGRWPCAQPETEEVDAIPVRRAGDFYTVDPATISFEHTNLRLLQLGSDDRTRSGLYRLSPELAASLVRQGVVEIV
jgi:hypothetical protein